MRGPNYKLALDVRRLWRCPACGYERRAEGRLTSLRCQCATNPFLQLVGEPRFQRLPNRPLDPYVRAEDILGPDEPTAAAPLSENSAPTPLTSEAQSSSPPPDEMSETSSVRDDSTSVTPHFVGGAASAVGSSGDIDSGEEPTTASEARGTSPDQGRAESDGRDRRRRRNRGRRDSRPPRGE